jgi:hypothetical protein
MNEHVRNPVLTNYKSIIYLAAIRIPPITGVFFSVRSMSVSIWENLRKHCVKARAIFRQVPHLIDLSQKAANLRSFPALAVRTARRLAG